MPSKPRQSRAPQSKLTEQELIRRDTSLLKVLNQWHGDASAKAGSHLACRPGCAQCCVGAFAINQLDAVRLQRGLQELAANDLPRAQRIIERAADSLERTAEFFPGDIDTGLLDTTPEAQEQFEEFANDEPCPALDPATQRCELYEYRPLTCRVYGPPVLTDGGVGLCELCFTTASEAEIKRAMVPLAGEAEEERLNQELETVVGPGQTIVAFALLQA